MKSSNCAHLLSVYVPLPWNGPIFAASGSGKSFAVLQMAMQFYGTHPTPRIVWIDNGASSKRMLDESILDGQFIELSLDSKLSLNMFDLPKGTTTPTSSKIKKRDKQNLRNHSQGQRRSNFQTPRSKRSYQSRICRQF